MKTTITLATAALMALATPAFANMHDKAELQEKFDKADTNSDGSLSPAEWNAAWPGKQDAWKKTDANNDGKVTLEEKEAAHKSE